MDLFKSNQNEPEKTDDFISIIDKMSKISKTKKKLSSLGLKKYTTCIEDRKIDKTINTIISENNISYNQIINVPISQKYPFNGLLFSYAIRKANKTENDNLYLTYFFKFYDDFNNLLVKMFNNEEKIFLFNQLINKINIEEKEENDILFKVGEHSEKFYFLLNGSTTKLIPYRFDAIMDKHEYYVYMKYLYKLDEIELFNLTLAENEESFDKFELLHFILGDKNIKFHADAIKQLKNIESSYITQRLFQNKLNENNFNNDKTIIITETKKKLDDVLKGDRIISCLDEKIRKIKVPIQEYINNFKPINFEDENEDLVKKNVSIYSYKIEAEINVGDHLEELDESRITKKISTIICNNHCIFGVLLKKDYINSLKITQTKFHKNDINFLLGNELFSTLNFPEFDRNYYRLFELMKKNQNHVLFIQKKYNDFIYFLKKGEVSVSLEGNIDDIYRIIGMKGGPKNRKLLDINYIKRFFSITIEDKFFEEIKNFAIFKINENFPIGMEDFLDEENDNKELFNAICNLDSEILGIKKENLNEITYREREIYKIKEKYIVKRKTLLIDKLNTLKNGLIQKYIYEKFKIKINLPDLFDESPLSPKKNKNIERLFIDRFRRKNDLTSFDTKVNGKSFREITSALKLKSQKDLEENNLEQKEDKKNKENEEDKNNQNEIGKNNDETNNIRIKTENNIDSNNINQTINNQNNTMNVNKFKKRRSIIRITNKNISNKYNKEIMELIKSPNPLIKIQKNKKVDLDPLDKIYKDLKYPSVKNSRSIKNFPNLRNQKNPNLYVITTFNVLTPAKPHKFIPEKRKIILPQKDFGFFNKKMKEIKVFKTINQDKSSVILKTEREPHDLYYDRNNMLLSTINFDDKKIKSKKKPLFNNIKINQSLNYKISKSIDKKSSGINTSDNEKSIVFPTIVNTSINKNIF